MYELEKINQMKEAHVVFIDGSIYLFQSRFEAEEFLEKEKSEEWKKDFEQGFITIGELGDITRHYGKYYMKLSDFVAGLNEFEAKITLLNLLIREIE